MRKNKSVCQLANELNVQLFCATNPIFHSKQNNLNTNIELRKEKLIALILALKREDVLNALEAIFEKNEKTYLIESETVAFSEPEVLYKKQAMRKTIDIEALKKERNYKHTDWERMKKLAREMDIQDPIEELLALLTK